MIIELPNIDEVINLTCGVKSTYDNKTKPISTWMEEHRGDIQYNNSLIYNKNDEADIKILRIFLVSLLMRFMRGERGEIIGKNITKYIISKSDLNIGVYERIISESGYRWKQDGLHVMQEVVRYFRDDLNWNWHLYFEKAQKSYDSNFQEDKLLKIKGISFKVRDLALSEFNLFYIANDLHIVRVSTRLGLLNYGFNLLIDTDLEMGNNPTNEKNYLFLHKLFLQICKSSKKEFYPSDLDRMFWHFGRIICGVIPKCILCPLNKICLTGQNIFWG